MVFGKSKRAPALSVTATSDALADRERQMLRVGLTALTIPGVVFAFLRWAVPAWDTRVVVPTEHFLIVSSACLVALAMAIALSYAAIQTREPRTFFLAATYLMIAAPFSVHGLMTPGNTFSMHAFHNSMTISAQLSLLLGAITIMLAALPTPTAIDRAIRNQFGPLMIGLILSSLGYILICLTFPTVFDWVPTGQEPAGVRTALGLERHAVGMAIRYLVTVTGVTMCAVAAIRFYRS